MIIFLSVARQTQRILHLQSVLTKNLERVVMVVNGLTTNVFFVSGYCELTVIAMREPLLSPGIILRSNLSNMDTKGTEQSVRIKEVTMMTSLI